APPPPPRPLSYPARDPSVQHPPHRSQPLPQTARPRSAQDQPAGRAPLKFPPWRRRGIPIQKLRLLGWSAKGVCGFSTSGRGAADSLRCFAMPATKSFASIERLSSLLICRPGSVLGSTSLVRSNHYPSSLAISTSPLHPKRCIPSHQDLRSPRSPEFSSPAAIWRSHTTHAMTPFPG